MSAFVVPDVHGNLDLLAGLLRQEGILDTDWERVDRETRVIQLGDLCNCVGSSVIDDNRCLDHATAWFDDYLVGNHEHPYFGGPRFSGFWADIVLGSRLRRLVTGAAVAVDGILISHAGLGARWAHAAITTPERAAESLNELWRDNPTARVFSQIGGARGGSAPWGGILWADWMEPKTTAFRQIVGHTVGQSIRIVEDIAGLGLAYCIDVGGKSGDRLAGAWIRDGEIETVEYRVAAAA